MGKPTHYESVAVVVALLVTVWVVQQMSHSEEGVIENTGWNSPLLSSNQQHALQQRHKFPPVSLLCLHVTIIMTQDQVHLTDKESKNTDKRQSIWLGTARLYSRGFVVWPLSQLVCHLFGLTLIRVISCDWTHMCYVIQTAEDVLSGFFGFKSRLFLVLFCSLRGQKVWN